MDIKELKIIPKFQPNINPETMIPITNKVPIYVTIVTLYKYTCQAFYCHQCYNFKEYFLQIRGEY